MLLWRLTTGIEFCSASTRCIRKLQHPLHSSFHILLVFGGGPSPHTASPTHAKSGTELKSARTYRKLVWFWELGRIVCKKRSLLVRLISWNINEWTKAIKTLHFGRIPNHFTRQVGIGSSREEPASNTPWPDCKQSRWKHSQPNSH